MLIEILGLIIGIIYLYWEYMGDRRLWIAAILMPAISLHVYYSSALYADFILNIYYLLIAIYGWWKWNREQRTENRVQSTEDRGQRTDIDKQQEFTPISLFNTTSRSMILCGAFATILLWLLIGWALSAFTDTDVPWTNAFTSALSILGMWMLTKKYTEQWWVWIAVDIVSCGLYTYKQIYFYAVLYAIYTIVAFFGYKKWKNKIKVDK